MGLFDGYHQVFYVAVRYMPSTLQCHFAFWRNNQEVDDDMYGPFSAQAYCGNRLGKPSFSSPFGFPSSAQPSIIDGIYWKCARDKKGTGKRIMLRPVALRLSTCTPSSCYTALTMCFFTPSRFSNPPRPSSTKTRCGTNCMLFLKASYGGKSRVFPSRDNNSLLRT